MYVNYKAFHLFSNMVNLLADEKTFSIDVDFKNSKQYYYDLKYQSKFKHDSNSFLL